MLHFLRSFLLFANMIVIPSTAILGWALAYGVEPVDFRWIRSAQSIDGGTTEFAQVCEPHVLSKPLYSRQALATFAAEAVVDLNNFDYLNWDQVLAPATERYMTPQAARLYMNAFRQGRLRAGIQREYLSVSAQLSSPAIITSESRFGTTRSWQVQVPVEIFYGSGARTVQGVKTRREMTQNFVYSLRLVEQSPSRKNYRGVAISEITATPIASKTVLERMRTERE
jgi:hypothetical protein